MSNLPRILFDGDLKRAHSEWLLARADSFRAKILANQLNNFVDRLSIVDNAGIANPRSLATLRLSLSAACPSFEIIRDVANGSKHCLLTQGNPRVSREDQTAEAGAFDEGFDNGFDTARIVITDDKGDPHEFEDLVEVVMRFFETELVKRGL